MFLSHNDFVNMYTTLSFYERLVSSFRCYKESSLQRSIFRKLVLYVAFFREENYEQVDNIFFPFWCSVLSLTVATANGVHVIE